MLTRRILVALRLYGRRSAERTSLDAGVKKIRPLLAEYGFEYVPGDEAVSSGGPFAVALFRRGDLEIGLIVRDGNDLGCPNYGEGQMHVGHSNLIWTLGHAGEEELVESSWTSYIAKSGGDPFVALRSDLRKIILPELRKSESGFRLALARAREKRRLIRGF